MADISVDSGRAPRERMEVRRVPFSYEHRTPKERAGHWNPGSPEFSQIVNSGSLAMPYLEPYLIRTMRAARDKITDPQLQKELDFYCAQESTHFRQHKKFNDTLSEAGYAAVREIEARVDRDYKKLGETKSLKFNLAYAEGFESMALAIGEMLIEDREYLFGNSDPATASLILWHFVEEIEHKNVTFDVFKHLHASYFWRMLGLVYATGHIFWRMGQGYRDLLREDGLWSNFKSRWRMLKLLGRIMKNVLPKWLRIWRPSYHPSQVPDPTWGLDWAELFDASPEGAANLDTTRLHEPQPVALPQS
ncbi:MAG: metal-dependent hydrolase [Rhodobiaceae bacterium]|nr:metal-dependent hydrolase [Rhodobiaceae bacterium]